MDGKTTNLKRVQRISELGHALQKLGIESRSLIKRQKQMRHELNELILDLEV